MTAAGRSGSRRRAAACSASSPSAAGSRCRPHAHGWWGLSTTGPLTRSVRDSALVYDVIRGTLPVDRWRADEPSTSFTAAVDARVPSRCGWAGRPSRSTLGVRPAPEHVAAVHDDRHPARAARPRRRGGRPRLPGPDRGVRAAVLRRRAHRRRRCRAPRPAGAPHQGDRAAGPLGHPCGARVGDPAGRAGRRPRRTGVRPRRRAAHPGHRAPPAAGRRPRRRGHGAGVAGGDADDRLHRAVERHRQPRGLGARRLRGRTVCRSPYSWSGGQHDETTLLTLSAQLERARPWAAARPAL